MSLFLLPLVMGLGLESFRAMYCPKARGWDYQELSALGFDAVYSKGTFSVRRMERNSKDAFEGWVNESLEAEVNGLNYICGPRYMARNPSFEYEHAVDLVGRQDHLTPSPVDDVYWTRVVEDVAVAVANLSLNYPISGVLWDIEYYGADVWKVPESYHYYSFDRLAVELFANETGRDIPSIPGSERHDWLESRGLVEDYKRWQEDAVYRMARRTRNKVRAINPELHLGTLGFEDDCWFHLAILKGFSAQDQPVTTWHQDTYYGGYKTGKIDYNHEVFVERGINGKVIPGLWTYDQDPFGLLQNMAFAMRYNGTFWIYESGGSYARLGAKDEYRLAFELLQEEVMFNSGGASFAPIFTVYPGIEVRPVIGPSHVSVFLLTRTTEPPSRVLKLPESFSGAWYVGANMTPKTLDTISLTLDDLPCFIYGLDVGFDPSALQATSKIQQLGELLELWEPLGLGSLAEAENGLEQAVQDLQAGNIDAANTAVAMSLDGAYEKILGVLEPYVEQGFANPRESPVPMVILNKINNAAKNLEAGLMLEGTKFMFQALEAWGEIPELTATTLCSILTFQIMLWSKKHKQK